MLKNSGPLRRTYNSTRGIWTTTVSIVCASQGVCPRERNFVSLKKIIQVHRVQNERSWCASWLEVHGAQSRNMLELSGIFGAVPRTARNPEFSATSACWVVSAAHRGLFYHASGKAFRALEISKTAVSCAHYTTVVLTLGISFLKATLSQSVRGAYHRHPTSYEFCANAICDGHATFADTSGP